MLARNEIDYGERAVTRIDTPDGGLYFLHFCIYVYNILCCGHINFIFTDHSRVHRIKINPKSKIYTYSIHIYKYKKKFTSKIILTTLGLP